MSSSGEFPFSENFDGQYDPRKRTIRFVIFGRVVSIPVIGGKSELMGHNRDFRLGLYHFALRLLSLKGKDREDMKD